MFKNILKDRVTLVKSSGNLEREEIPDFVNGKSIHIQDVTLLIEVGDHLLRSIPNGLVEDYIVEDPVLHSGLGRKFYEVAVRRNSSQEVAKGLAIQNITNNFNGPNSRVNLFSTDNSINMADGINIEKLRNFLDQATPFVSALPNGQRMEITAQLKILEDQVQSG